MNILLIHPHDIHSPLEPWTVRIVSFAREFVKKGHNVKLAHFPRLDNKRKVSLATDGIEVIAFNRKTGPYVFLANIIKMWRLVRGADIVHFQKCFHWASLPALVAGYLAKKPLHYDWDDWEEKIYCLSHKKPQGLIVLFLRILERWIPKLVDTISVSSEYLKNLCLGLGIDKEKISKVPVGADLEKFNPHISQEAIEAIRKRYGLNGPVVIYLGQLHSAQYARIFLEAADTISKQDGKVSFMIIGDGSLLLDLERFSKNLRLKNIIFTGYVPHQEIPPYIATADICVASFEDNVVTRCKSPLKIAEYLAAGKPIVASNVGEVKYMLGDAGILVEPGQPQPLARQITHLLSDKALRDELGTKARQRAKDIYNWEASSETLLKAYKLAIERQ